MTSGASGTSDTGVDRPAGATDRVLRRALVAGIVVAAVVAALLAGAVLWDGGGGALGLAALLSGVTVGALTASGWLLLALLLDLLAGRVPGVRRLWWALGLAALGFIGPVFILGALSAAAG